MKTKRSIGVAGVCLLAVIAVAATAATDQQEAEQLIDQASEAKARAASEYRAKLDAIDKKLAESLRRFPKDRVSKDVIAIGEAAAANPWRDAVAGDRVPVGVAWKGRTVTVHLGDGFNPTDPKTRTKIPDIRSAARWEAGREGNDIHGESVIISVRSETPEVVYLINAGDRSFRYRVD